MSIFVIEAGGLAFCGIDENGSPIFDGDYTCSKTFPSAEEAEKVLLQHKKDFGSMEFILGSINVLRIKKEKEHLFM